MIINLKPAFKKLEMKKKSGKLINERKLILTIGRLKKTRVDEEEYSGWRNS